MSCVCVSVPAAAAAVAVDAADRSGRTGHQRRRGWGEEGEQSAEFDELVTDVKRCSS